MRTVIVSNIMSLDGFYEGPGQNVERIRGAGTPLLGRKSYEGFSNVLLRYAPRR